MYCCNAVYKNFFLFLSLIQMSSRWHMPTLWCSWVWCRGFPLITLQLLWSEVHTIPLNPLSHSSHLSFKQTVSSLRTRTHFYSTHHTCSYIGKKSLSCTLAMPWLSNRNRNVFMDVLMDVILEMMLPKRYPKEECWCRISAPVTILLWEPEA